MRVSAAFSPYSSRNGTVPSSAYWSAWRTSWRRRSGPPSPPCSHTQPTVVPPRPYVPRGIPEHSTNRSGPTRTCAPWARAHTSASAVAGAVRTARYTAHARPARPTRQPSRAPPVTAPWDRRRAPGVQRGTGRVAAPGRTRGQDAPVEIERVPVPPPADVLDGLADVLRDAVDDGASVGFPAVPDPAAARAWWASWLTGGAWTWVARGGSRVVGTVSLVLAGPANGAHRAELVKLLVHRDARGRGTAGALVAAAEAEAARAGRWLLVLDTETGSAAESVYPRWGWRRVGTVEGYALSPRGTFTGTTFFAKTLPGAPRGRDDDGAAAR